MKLKEKNKILAAVAAVLAAIVFFSAAMLLWQTLRFKNSFDAAADGLRLETAVVSARERLKLMHTESALEEQSSTREALLEVAQTRAEEFTNSLLILVNPWNEVPSDYEVELSTVDGYLTDRRCARALQRMLSDCRAEGYLPVICSAYRTQAYQEMLYRNKILRLLAEGVANADAPDIAARSVALPGTSEHQLGLAIDIISETYTNLDAGQERTEVQQWLMQNCWRYGFILRYPNGTSDTTGIIYEPWHYRYVGPVTAKAVTESGLVFEDYLESLELS